MKTVFIDVVTILIYLLFKRYDLFNLFELQMALGPPEGRANRTGIELDLIL